MVAAIPSGFHADGYAGDKLELWITWYFSFDELNDFVQNESIEPAWPIHEGNLFSEQSRWILKMTSLIRTYVNILKASAHGEEGNL